jgi:hypothetical protein
VFSFRIARITDTAGRLAAVRALLATVWRDDLVVVN